MNTKVINKYNHVITMLCVAALLLGVFAYMYFLSLSVVHVVMKKEATQNINQLRSEIALLETSYIEARYQINNRIASIDGLNETQNKIFISQAEQNLVLRTTN
jgi:Tfp pilus assembly protein PilN